MYIIKLNDLTRYPCSVYNFDNKYLNIKCMRPLGQRYRFDLLEYHRQCDLNYVYLFKLLGRNSEQFQSRVMSSDAADEAISFDVLENTRYTTTINITRKMPKRVGDLKFTVRVFHDVQCADLLSFQGQHEYDARYTYPNSHMRSPDEKTQNTRFLGEILQVCVIKNRKFRKRTKTLIC